MRLNYMFQYFIFNPLIGRTATIELSKGAHQANPFLPPPANAKQRADWAKWAMNGHRWKWSTPYSELLHWIVLYTYAGPAQSQISWPRDC